MNRTLLIAGLALALLATLPIHAARADATEETLTRLQAELERLEARIATLEALTPTFTAFMPNFSERFHLMHAAGDAGDWALADHELKELQRLIGVAALIDAEKGKLMHTMLTPAVEKLESAIQHRSGDSFRKAMGATVTSCNACHAATGSAFIKVALDVPEGMTMRHPHTLGASKPLSGHAH